jgi:glycosyltransferase involved in cell wall biosynthesis
VQIHMTTHHGLDRDTGAAGVTIRLAEQYSAAGHDVELLSFDDLPAWVPPRLRPVVFPTFVAGRVRRRMRSGTLDVLDASTGDSALLDRASPWFRRVLLVVRSHGLEHTSDRRFRSEAAAGMFRLSWRHSIYHGGYRLWEVARAMRRADLCLVLNDTDRELAIHELHVERDRVHVVPNGVSGSLVLVEGGSPSAATRPVRRIVQIGSYLPMKGTAYGRPAIAALLSRHPGIRMAFLGAACPSERVLADFDPTLHDRIDVIPRYRNEHLAELLHGDDLNVLPTLSEGFGLALLEAMARGIPSVVTATSGPIQFCRDGVNALVVPPADAQALHDAVERLITNGDLRERLSRAGVTTARQHVWPTVARLNLRIYEQHRASKGMASTVATASGKGLPARLVRRRQGGRL